MIKEDAHGTKWKNKRKLYGQQRKAKYSFWIDWEESNVSAVQQQL